MSKSRIAILALVLTPLTAACGSSLTVEVYTEAGDDVSAVGALEVQFIPFDRDSLFEALSAQAATPEPQVPADVRAAFDSVLVLQATWRQAETSWNETRDSLRSLSDRLSGLDPRAGEYRQLFERFNSMEGRERSLNGQRQTVFDTFTGLQQATQERLDSVRIVIDAWENEAFAEYVDIEAELLDALGREIMMDTTDVDGRITRSLPGGNWWIHARVAVPSGELYWNILTDPGTTDTLRLEPGNALRRLAF